MLVSKIRGNKFCSNKNKASFTLLELSVSIVIITIILATILISKILITTAKVNKVQTDYRDINMLMSIFQNTFGCLPGDCNITELPQTIINGTPSGCFNLSTTTGMGNSITTGNSPATTSTLSTPIIATFGTGTLSYPTMQTERVPFIKCKH